MPDRQLPFLEALCWELKDVENLTPLEILQTYERGWRFLNVLAQPDDNEWQLIRDLSSTYGSWLQSKLALPPSLMKYQWHDLILVILQSLRADALQEWGIYFGGGTLISLLNGEYRLSQDIDFITNDRGYRELRNKIQECGYDALFKKVDRLHFPRQIQADQYGVRFPIAIDRQTIKLEIISEGRISLDKPIYPHQLPVPCLSTIDCWAEKLLANADRWSDDRTRARDLIDLSVLRLAAQMPDTAVKKAENAYTVIPALNMALDRFQTNPDWRYRCYQSLEIDRSDLIIDGIDLLAADRDRSATIRTLAETQVGVD
jgi:predicted nucleotidyltransferase component of viral defense system